MVESSSDQEQIKAVLQYLQKKETRIQALDIVLAYTATKDNRALFTGLDICKILLRLLPEEGAGVAQKVAQCLINFSTDPDYQKDLIKLNVGGRIFDFLKDHVQMNMKAVEDSGHAAFIEDKKIYEIRALTLAKNDSQGVYDSIELCLMLLTNVTVSEEGQKHLIGEGRTKGLILDNLFGMFCFFLKSGIFDFISNILANVTALKEGRDVVNDFKMLPKIVDMLRWEKVSIHRRKHLLDCLRNVAFGYEALESQFVELKLTKELGHLLAIEQGIHEGLPESVAQFTASKKAFHETNKENIKNIIDTFILLSNSDVLMKEMAELNLDTLIDYVDIKGKEELDTNITVLKTQIQQSRFPAIEGEQ